MRSLFLFAALAGLAQAAPTLGTLLVDSPLRGAARSDATETGSLAKGAQVIVHHEEGDWLAVQPPRGSVSWISHLFLEFPDKTPNAGFPKNAVVRSDGDVKLAVGKAGQSKPLDIRKTAVPDGTIVLVIGPAVKSDSDGSTWYPIVPPEDDFRYLLKSAVQQSSATAPGFVVTSPVINTASPPSTASLAVPSPQAVKPNWPNHPLWLQAEQAEQTGDLDKAEKLYFQLAKEMNAPGGDGDLANLCYSRVHAIRERRRQSSGNTKPDNWNATPGNIAPSVVAQAAATTSDKPAADRSEKPAPGPSQWSGTGYLRIAGFKVDKKQYYALEDFKGGLKCYAVPAAGFDIEKYRNKTVDLFGTATTPKDLRGVMLFEVSKVDLVK